MVGDLHTATIGELIDDIALIQIPPVEFNTNIQPICLDHDYGIPLDTDCIISGWGRTLNNPGMYPYIHSNFM